LRTAKVLFYLIFPRYLTPCYFGIHFAIMPIEIEFCQFIGSFLKA